jgi:glycosyltransferase involved in cell wall biosynthesis
VDLPRFRDARAEDFFDRFPQLRGKRIFLCVSRVDPQKNQILLLEAFAHTAGSLPDHHLVFIGAEVVEEYGRRLREEIAACGLGDRVTWIPGLAPDDPALPGAFRAAEAFVLPSAHEPFGIVILEAWAASLPVIATRVGGIPGFTTDVENILLTPSGEGEALADKLRTLAGSTDLRHALARNGFLLAESRYDWPAIARQLLELYPQPESQP